MTNPQNSSTRSKNGSALRNKGVDIVLFSYKALAEPVMRDNDNRSRLLFLCHFSHKYFSRLLNLAAGTIHRQALNFVIKREQSRTCSGFAECEQNLRSERNPLPERIERSVRFPNVLQENRGKTFILFLFRLNERFEYFVINNESWMMKPAGAGWASPGMKNDSCK